MFIVIFLFWIILNGRITPEICLVGAVLAGLIVWIMHVLFGYDPREDLKNGPKIPLFLKYYGILFWEIIKVNFAVMSLILRGNKAIDPVLVTFRPKLKTEFGRYLLANAITLTPGTITVEIVDGIFTVHCLKRSLLDISDDGAFVTIIRKLEA